MEKEVSQGISRDNSLFGSKGNQQTQEKLQSRRISFSIEKKQIETLASAPKRSAQPKLLSFFNQSYEKSAPHSNRSTTNLFSTRPSFERLPSKENVEAICTEFRSSETDSCLRIEKKASEKFTRGCGIKFERRKSGISLNFLSSKQSLPLKPEIQENLNWGSIGFDPIQRTKPEIVFSNKKSLRVLLNEDIKNPIPVSRNQLLEMSNCKPSEKLGSRSILIKALKKSTKDSTDTTETTTTLRRDDSQASSKKKVTFSRNMVVKIFKRNPDKEGPF